MAVFNSKAWMCAAALAAMLAIASCALAQTAVVDSGKLNMRTQPSRDSRSLGGFYSGTKVEIVSDAGEGWSEVNIGSGSGSVSGYMMSEYLATGSDMGGVRDSTYNGEVVSPYGTQSVVLRDAPSNSYGAVGMQPVGESVRVIGESGDFYYVRTGDNAVGCLSSDEVN